MMIRQYVNQVLEYCNTHPYTTGLISGVLSVLLLWLIIKLLTRSCVKRCTEIVISDELGVVTVSARAVADLVRCLQQKISGLLIQHVELLENKKDHSVFLRIFITADSRCSHFTDTAAEFKKSVFFTLQTMFGVTSITRIELVIRKVEDLPDGNLPDGE